MVGTRVRALSFHARYGCANSGACCTAGWPIPVEASALPLLQRALDTREVLPAGDGPLLTFPEDRPAEVGAVLGRTSSGACVFFDRAQRDGRCRVHRHAGLAAMPIACRQFPRIVRHDARGTDVSLSHWCPTALAGLDADAPVTIVEMPPAFTAAHALDGLDARATWPPLLRHDCLWSLDAFEAFETQVVDLLGNSRAPLEARVTTVGTWAEQLRSWTPAHGALHDVVEATAPRVPDMPADAEDRRATAEDEANRWAAVVDAIPAGLRDRMPAGMHGAGPTDEALLEVPAARDRVGRYLAARVFGSWVAYQGHDVAALAASVATALTAVRRGLAVEPGARPTARVGAAIRAADLLLVHLATPEVLAARYDALARRTDTVRVTAASAGARDAAALSRAAGGR